MFRLDGSGPLTFSFFLSFALPPLGFIFFLHVVNSTDYEVFEYQPSRSGKFQVRS